jgi:hypothetical protein
MAGEMSASEVTPENYPLYFAIANHFGGEVKPFDQYQGPYIALRNPVAKLWLISDDGVFFKVYNENNEKQSEPFLRMYDNEFDSAQAIDAAEQVLDLSVIKEYQVEIVLDYLMESQDEYENSSWTPSRNCLEAAFAKAGIKII